MGNSRTQLSGERKLWHHNFVAVLKQIEIICDKAMVDYFIEAWTNNTHFRRLSFVSDAAQLTIGKEASSFFGSDK